MPDSRDHEVVLIVEDETTLRRMMSMVLSREGFRVLEAEDGRQALRIVTDAKIPIDVIVTDIVMPWMGGEELIEELRAAGHRIPIICTSGYVSDAGDLTASAPDALLAKPFTGRELVTAIESVIRRRN